MKLDFNLTCLKVVNFLLQAGLACFLPYKSILQKQLGISEAQNGIIMAVEKVFSLIAPSFMGSLTDQFSLHKSAMIACSILSVVFSFPFYFIPSMELENVTISISNQSCENINCFSTNLSSASCENLCQSCEFFCHKKNEYGLTFVLVLLFSILFVIFSVPLASLVDATTVSILGNDRLHLYGMQRLWGAVGFGLIGLLVGFLVDVYSKSYNATNKDYLLAFICLTLFHFFTAAVIGCLEVPKHRLTSLLVGLSTFVKNPQIFVFLTVIFLSGFNLGTRYAFTFWYIEQLPGSSTTILGLSVLTGCFSEIPMFFASGWILKKIGYHLTLSLGLLASALQCFLYTVITVAWPILLIEALHGISFALPMAAMCTYAAELAPKGMAATLIGLTQGIYWGLGNMAGSLSSGLLYKAYGGKTMFLINSLIAVIGSIWYYILATLLRKCIKKDKKSIESQVKIEESTKSPMLEIAEIP